MAQNSKKATTLQKIEDILFCLIDQGNVADIQTAIANVIESENPAPTGAEPSEG